MAEQSQKYNITEPIGVEYAKGDTEGWINCVDATGQLIRLHVKAAILVQLLADLQKGLKVSTRSDSGES